MGQRDVRQWQHSPDARAQQSFGRQAYYVFQLGSAYAADPQQSSALEENTREIDGNFLSDQLSYQRIAAMQRQAIKGCSEDAAPNGVDDHIYPLPTGQGANCLGKVVVHGSHDDIGCP